MRIQLISNGRKSITTDQEYTKTSFSEPISFDMFDVNIIDLQCESLWTNRRDDFEHIDCLSDFETILELVKRSEGNVIFALPQNYYFSRYLSPSGKYQYFTKLKDMIGKLQRLLTHILPPITYENYSLVFENAITQLGDKSFPSAFYFDSSLEAVTYSVNSTHATTVKVTEKCFMTTLDLSSGASLDALLCAMGILEDTPLYPEWLLKTEKFDDKEKKDLILRNNERIFSLQKENEQAVEKIKENMKFKSILITNGSALVSVVFEILEKLLSCDLSKFKDENKEDFLIHIENLTFIGEIKGVTSNVKSEHVSQLDVHYQGYVEELPVDTQEEVYSLLIVNPFRTKPLNEREPVHDNQIKLAKRNGSLIVTTELLLILFERFLKDEVSTDMVKELFTKQKGLLDLSNS